MRNKYWYAFVKDGGFRVWFFLAIIGAVLCLVLFRALITEGSAQNELRRQRAVIAEIPQLRAQIASMGAVNGLFLSGIISGKKQPMAVINGQLVKVGGEIDGRKVTQIVGHDVTVCETADTQKCGSILNVEHKNITL